MGYCQCYVFFDGQCFVGFGYWVLEYVCYYVGVILCLFVGDVGVVDFDFVGIDQQVIGDGVEEG